MERTSSTWKIIRELYHVAQVQRRAANTAPLGPIALGVLNMAAQQPLRPKVAATALDVPAQSITRAVAELVELDLVRRVEADDDGRSYLIVATPAGAQECARFRDALLDRYGDFLANWSDREISEFAEKLSQLVSAIAKDVPSTSTGGGRNPWRSK